MNILIIHNFYESSVPSGENIVVMAEINQLQENGHNVRIFKKETKIKSKYSLIDLLHIAINMVHNFQVTRDINKILEDYNPDLVHIHNTFPLISYGIISSIKKKNIPIVATMHNFRTQCVSGVFLREGGICTKCITPKKRFFPALIHRCYERSLLGTFLLILNNFYIYKFKLLKKVDALIVLSEFAKNIYLSLGIDSNIIHVKHSFNSIKNLVNFKTPLTSFDVLYVGRISREKGVFTMAKAWRMMGNEAPKLTIIGSGIDEKEIRKITKNLNVEFLNKINHEEIIGYMSKAKLLLMPSECFEGSPLVAFEAIDVGLPILASNLGPLPEIINKNNGYLFEAFSEISLVSMIKYIKNNTNILNSANNRLVSNNIVSASKHQNYEKLIEIYNSVLK